MSQGDCDQSEGREWSGSPDVACSVFGFLIELPLGASR